MCVCVRVLILSGFVEAYGHCNSLRESVQVLQGVRFGFKKVWGGFQLLALFLRVSACTAVGYKQTDRQTDRSSDINIATLANIVLYYISTYIHICICVCVSILCTFLEFKRFKPSP